MDNSGDLRLLLASRYPLIVAEGRDEARLMEQIRQAAAGLGMPVWTWSVTRGLARDGFEGQYGTREPLKALEFLSALDGPGVFVFADAHPALGDALVVRRLKEIAQLAREGQTIVLTMPTSRVPPELVGLALPWSLKPPGREELAALVRRTMDQLAARGIPVAMDQGGEAGLVEALRGLSTMEAGRLIQEAALRDGGLHPSDVGFVRRAKAQFLEDLGPVELIQDDQTLESVGGLEGLKAWLLLRGRALEPEAAEFGLDAPRGVLLTGVPGCGKSLVAKTIAATWGLPLVLLDPARMYGPYVGESEQRLREALQTVEAMAPAVLWIDEIEKGFASGGTGDGGVSRRILSTFLRWMQERPPGVFVVATANDVVSLPPEFLRKGRFDEVFFVDLPDQRGREDILRMHLAKRGRDPASFDLAGLARAAEGFSGAEIESAVVGALYRAYGAGVHLSTAEVLSEISATIPLSRSRAEDVAALRAWASERAVAA